MNARTTRMVRGGWILAMAMGISAAGGAEEGGDPRNIANGRALPTEGFGYADQPYPLLLPGDRWLVMLTVGTESETGRNSENYTAAMISADRGRTWTKPVRCNRSYAVPLSARGGRLFALTPMAFTWSDDGGRNWSDPVKIKAFPPTGPSNGPGHEGPGWSVSRPLVIGGSVLLSWAKIGLSRPPRRTEVYFLRSPDLLTTAEPAKASWELLPADGRGLRGPEWDEPKNRSEEPHTVALSDGTLYCVWRTDRGHIGHATSGDGGRTWSKPEALRYGPGRRVIKHPLACPSLWKCVNGKYLLWIHNHGPVPALSDYAERNPAWVCGGIERDGTIVWSEPEVLLYGHDLRPATGRISYPGLLEADGAYWLFETQKTRARVHRLDAPLLAAAWGQQDARSVTKLGLAVEADSEDLADGAFPMPELPDLADGGGVTIDLRLTWPKPPVKGLILDARDRNGEGLAVAATEEGTAEVYLHDGRTTVRWDCDPGLLTPGRTHRVIFIVDAGPRIVSVVVDGKLCDGGEHRPYGWTHFARPVVRRPKPAAAVLKDVNGAPRAKVAGSIRHVRIYTRALRTSEAVGNCRAGGS